MPNFAEQLKMGNPELAEALATKGLKTILKEGKTAFRNLSRMKRMLAQIAAWRKSLELEQDLRDRHLLYLCEGLRLALRFTGYSHFNRHPMVAELKKTARNFKLTITADNTGLWVKLVKDGRNLTKRYDSLTPLPEILGWITQRTL